MKLFLLCAAVAVAQEHFGSVVIEIFSSSTDCSGPSEFLTVWEQLCIPFPSSNPARRTWTAVQASCGNPNLPGQAGQSQPSASVRVYGNPVPGCSGGVIATFTTAPPPVDPRTVCGSVSLATSPPQTLFFKFRNITCASYLTPVGGVQYTRPFQLATFAADNCGGDVRRDLLNVNPFSSCSWGGFRGERGSNFTLSPAGPGNVVSTGNLTVFNAPTPSVSTTGQGCDGPTSALPSLIPIPPRTGGLPASNPSPGACVNTPGGLNGVSGVNSFRVEEVPSYTPPGAGRIPTGLEPWAVALIIISVMLIVGTAVYFGNKWGYCVFKAAPMKAPMPPPGGARAKAPPMPGSLAPSSTGVGGGAAMKAPGQPQLGLPAPPPSGGAGSRGGALPNPLNVINNSTPGVSEWANKRG